MHFEMEVLDAKVFFSSITALRMLRTTASIECPAIPELGLRIQTLINNGKFRARFPPLVPSVKWVSIGNTCSESQNMSKCVLMDPYRY